MLERLYSPKEVSELLGIASSTLRKICLLLESNGYAFRKDEHGRKEFLEHDLNALKYFQYLTGEGHKQEQAALLAVEKAKTLPVTEQTAPPTEALLARMDEEHRALFTEIITRFDKQEEFNRALVEKLQEQSDYINQSINRRDEQLMSFIREKQEETKKQLAAANEEKGKWWKFWA